MSWNKAPKEAEACKDFAERALKRIAELEASIESKSDIINRLYSQIENMEKHNPMEGE